MSIKEVTKNYYKLPKESIKIIIETLKYLEETDKKEYSRYCDILANIIELYPGFNIKMDQSVETSFFCCETETIYMNDNDVITFIHELTHAQHYYNSLLEAPTEFSTIFNRIITTSDFQNHSRLLLDYTIKEQNSIRNNMNMSQKNDLLNNNQSDTNFIYYRALCEFQGFIDSLHLGSSHDTGIHCCEDSNNNCIKLPKSYGHGKDYFENEKQVFAEMLASYSSIRNTPYKDLFIKLISAFYDQELITLLESYYFRICEFKIISDSNKNIIL